MKINRYTSKHIQKWFWMCLLTLMVNNLSAQKHDYNWRFGYSGEHVLPGTYWGRTVFDFTKYYDEDFITYDDQDNTIMSFWNTCTVISDAEGKYLFSYNGTYVEDASLKLMLNGNNMSESGDERGESMIQGGIALPYPNQYQKYILLHMNLHYFDTEISFAGKDLHYSVIDMDKNGGLGAVVEKRNLILSDTLDGGKLAATRHANGRDWWIIVHRNDSDEYWRLLVNEQGVQIAGKDSTGLELKKGLGQSQFSKDGSKFGVISNINAEFGNYLYLYDFDRCTGKLSSPEVHHFALGSLIRCGFSFSPNGNILYLFEHLKLYQFDLTQENIWSTKTLIAETQDIKDTLLGFTFRPVFNRGEIGPDGKIYMPIQLGRIVSTIDYPDVLGEGCQVTQAAIILPTLNDGTTPYSPNFRLGPLEGSPCDTLGIVNFPLSRWRADQSEEDYLEFRMVDVSDYEPTEWLWDFGDGNTSEERHPTHSFSQDGIYEICLTVSNAHGSDTHCETFNVGTTSVGEERIAIEVGVYPNPMQNDLFVDIKDYYPREARVVLYDMQGRKVKEQRVYHGSNHVYVGGLAAGMYLCRVEDGGVELKVGKVTKL